MIIILFICIHYTIEVDNDIVTIHIFACRVSFLFYFFITWVVHFFDSHQILKTNIPFINIYVIINNNNIFIKAYNILT